MKTTLTTSGQVWGQNPASPQNIDGVVVVPTLRTSAINTLSENSQVKNIVSTGSFGISPYSQRL